MSPRKVPLRPELYLISDRHAALDGDLLGACEAALAGGLRRIQLREKDLTAAELTPLAERLRSLTRTAGAELFLNLAGDRERVELASTIEVDGLHLPSMDLGRPELLADVAQLRRVRPELLLGASTHGVIEIERAFALAADFATIGPVFETPSKRALGHPIGLAGLAAASAQSPIPLYGLGGIGPAEVHGVVRAGAVGVGCIRAVLAAADPEAAARTLIHRVRIARSASSAPSPLGEAPETP